MTLGIESRTPFERGMTLIELVIVLGLASALVTAIAAYSVPAIGREVVRSTAFGVQSFMQLARIEAVKRNRPCRLVVDDTSGELRVWDTNATTVTTDDEMLHELRLPDSVVLAAPGGGAAVTLEALGGHTFQSTFGSNGAVDSGVGAVSLASGERYWRISLLGAGGVLIETWSGSDWEAL